MFLVHFQQFLDVMPTSCSMVIIGNFIIDMLDQNSTQPNELQIFMDHYYMNFSLKITITYGSHIDHVWTNAPIQQCHELSKLIGLAISQFILHINS